MAGKPHDWNLVIVGAWNVAILNPQGIVRRLFAKDSNTPVQVEVPINQPGPIRVILDNVLVIPASERLIIADRKPSLNGLRKVSEVGRRALESLPETPLTSAGVNIRYQYDAIPDEFIEVLKSNLDDKLGEKGHRIVGRVLKRSLSWNGGVLNIEIHEREDASGLVQFNFHQQSTENAKLTSWLGQVEEMLDCTSDLLKSTLGVDVPKIMEETESG